MMQEKYDREPWIHPDVELRSSRVHGRGMFAKSTLETSEVVVVWGGTFVTLGEAERAMAQGKIFMQLDDDLYSIEEPGRDDTYFMNLWGCKIHPYLNGWRYDRVMARQMAHFSVRILTVSPRRRHSSVHPLAPSGILATCAGKVTWPVSPTDTNQFCTPIGVWQPAAGFAPGRASIAHHISAVRSFLRYCQGLGIIPTISCD